MFEYIVKDPMLAWLICGVLLAFTAYHLHQVQRELQAYQAIDAFAKILIETMDAELAQLFDIVEDERGELYMLRLRLNQYEGRLSKFGHIYVSPDALDAIANIKARIKELEKEVA